MKRPLSKYSTCKTCLCEFYVLDDGISYSPMLLCRYRLHRKLFMEKVIQALDIYQERLLF